MLERAQFSRENPEVRAGACPPSQPLEVNGFEFHLLRSKASQDRIQTLDAEGLSGWEGGLAPAL